MFDDRRGRRVSQTNSGAALCQPQKKVSVVVVIVEFVEIGGLGKLALLKQRSTATIRVQLSLSLSLSLSAMAISNHASRVWWELEFIHPLPAS